MKQKRLKIQLDLDPELIEMLGRSEYEQTHCAICQRHQNQIATLDELLKSHTDIFSESPICSECWAELESPYKIRS